MTKPANLANLAKGTSSAADAVGNPSAALAISRRRAALLLASFAAVSVGGRSIARADPVSGGAAVGSIRTIEPDEGPELIREAVAAVLPENGFSSRIALKDSLLRLVAEGVIDPQRFASAYRDRGGIPVELSFRLRWPSHLPIRLTAENAGYYVNLLWPIGLANAIEGNRASPVNGPSLLRFASTAGWTLGQEENGGTYFNRFRIVELTREQEEMAIRVAQNTYRPCCNNSTFFQDCNHGSALFGLLQLGASQGLGEADLYAEALAFNSSWFLQTYVQTAVYFKLFEGKEWAELDPKLLLSARYSAIGPWQATVGSKLAGVPGLLPALEGGASCGA